MELIKQETQNVLYQISGEAQNRDTNFMKSLKNDSFKEAVISFPV